MASSHTWDELSSKGPPNGASVASGDLAPSFQKSCPEAGNQGGSELNRSDGNATRLSTRRPRRPRRPCPDPEPPATGPTDSRSGSPPSKRRRLNNGKALNAGNTCKKRREVTDMCGDTLKRVAAELLQLLAEGKTPPPFHLAQPTKVMEGRRVKGYRCAWVEDEDGEAPQACNHFAKREAEARRHRLSHTALRCLCRNPACPKLFSREDAVKRHLNESKWCKMAEPRWLGRTEAPIMMNMMNGVQQLVTLQWSGIIVADETIKLESS